MPSATEQSKSRAAASNLLKGIDFYSASPKITSLKVKVREVRDPGGDFSSPLVMDVEPIEQLPGKTSLPLNRTNINKLVELLGDDYATWAGAAVVLERVLTRNPDGGQAWGLRIKAAKASR